MAVEASSSSQGLGTCCQAKNFLPLHAESVFDVQISRGEGQQQRRSQKGARLLAQRIAWAVACPNDLLTIVDPSPSLSCTRAPPAPRGSLEKDDGQGLPRLICLWRERQISMI